METVNTKSKQNNKHESVRPRQQNNKHESVCPQQTRNFSIIAHVDHGKSTLADRFIEHCNGLQAREMRDQVLDSMDIEQERGITIKAQTVALRYQAQDGQCYRFNLIDTPGHVDFGYEVSRSLLACEGALLVVDASQGVQAQSIANCYQAINRGLEVLPVLNKMDLPAADPQRVREDIEDIIGISATNAVSVSAKTGQGVHELLEAIIRIIPPPQVQHDQEVRVLVVDSWFDSYVGVVLLVRVMSGCLRPGMKVLAVATAAVHTIDQVGIFTPRQTVCAHLEAGQVGYIIAGIRKIKEVQVGDTLTDASHPTSNPLPGYEAIKPRVFAGFFPVNAGDYKTLRRALEKLSLNDASLFFEAESSQALGYGFRCGFLGLLHMEIIQERLEREYEINLLVTAPTVTYRVKNKQGQMIDVHNPSVMPSSNEIDEIAEPMMRALIISPRDYVGNIIGLCMEKRGQQENIYYTQNHVNMEFLLPLGEVVFDFFDRLKSLTQGYASFDYSLAGYRPAQMVKLDILLNGERVDSLASIVHHNNARSIGLALVDKMKTLVPRQMYDVAIQAAVGSRVIARANVKALRKDVTAKCYGGDVTRKRKLLESQKAGKKRMKKVGKIEVPQSAFLAILKAKSSFGS